MEPHKQRLAARKFEGDPRPESSRAPSAARGRRTAEKMAALRAVAHDCRLLAMQYAQLRERRDGLALECVDAGETWRDVAEAAGFHNPYIAELKRRRDASE